jgi:hypothetical protein
LVADGRVRLGLSRGREDGRADDAGGCVTVFTFVAAAGWATFCAAVGADF